MSQSTDRLKNLTALIACLCKSCKKAAEMIIRPIAVVPAFTFDLQSLHCNAWVQISQKLLLNLHPPSGNEFRIIATCRKINDILYLAVIWNLWPLPFLSVFSYLPYKTHYNSQHLQKSVSNFSAVRVSPHNWIPSSLVQFPPISFSNSCKLTCC